jgi:phosphate transport system substrate-binding protein
VKLYNAGRASIVAGLLASAVVISACSSSGGNSSPATTAAAGGGTSATSAGGSTAPSSSAAAPICSTGTLNADGSTAQQNAITQWAKDYQTACSGATINYSGGGSGQGVTDFKSGKVDFAGSDSALSAAKGEVAAAATRCGSPALDIPMVTGPIAISFKLNGVTGLTLTPKLIAQIFLGTITKWNDPAIAAANSGVSLPSTPITVFFRSDQSGTTQNFETYLAATDPADFTATPSKVWAGKVGQGKSGSQGVQQGIQGTEGSIGYLEWSYSGGQGITNAKVDNGGGAVALTAASAGAAVSAAQIVGTGNDLTLKLDYTTTAAGAYPIILVTYEIVCTKYADAAKGTLIKNFLTYTANGGQAGLPDLGYAPLPAGILAKVQTSIAAIS